MEGGLVTGGEDVDPTLVAPDSRFPKLGEIKDAVRESQTSQKRLRQQPQLPLKKAGAERESSDHGRVAEQG
jgi:hypothetical protein